MSGLKKASNFLIGFAILNVLWYAFGVIMQSRIAPMPHEVYAYIPKLFAENFMAHFCASLFRMVIGLIISFVIGFVVGLLMGSSKRVNKILNPLLYFTYPIPKTALLPIVMTIYGLGDGSKIAIIVLITVFQVIIGVRDGVTNVSAETYHSLIGMGATRLQLFFHATLPAILPELLTNLRLSVGTALSILFFVEAYGTTFGIGYFIGDAWSRMNYIQMYCGIVVLSCLGLILFVLIDFFESILCKWKG